MSHAGGRGRAATTERRELRKRHWTMLKAMDELRRWCENVLARRVDLTPLPQAGLSVAMSRSLELWEA